MPSIHILIFTLHAKCIAPTSLPVFLITARTFLATSISFLAQTLLRQNSSQVSQGDLKGLPILEENECRKKGRKEV